MLRPGNSGTQHRRRSHQHARRRIGPDSRRVSSRQPPASPGGHRRCFKASFFHLRRLRQQGWPANSLLGWATDANATPSPVSPPSREDCDRDRRRRSPPRLEEMAVAELTGLPPISAGYPDGMRTIVHRRRPHSARNSTATHRLSRREVRVGQLRTARCVRRWRTASMGPSLPLCT